MANLTLPEVDKPWAQSLWSPSSCGIMVALTVCSRILGISVSPASCTPLITALNQSCPELQLKCCSWNSPSSSSTVLWHLNINYFQIADFSIAYSPFLVLKDTSPYFKSQNLPFPHSRSAPPCRPALLVYDDNWISSPFPRCLPEDGCLLLLTGTHGSKCLLTDKHWPTCNPPTFLSMASWLLRLTTPELTYNLFLLSNIIFW